MAFGRSVGNILMDVLEMQCKYTDGFDIRKQGFVNCLESEAGPGFQGVALFLRLDYSEIFESVNRL